MFRIWVTGGPPNFGGGGIPQRITISSRPPSAIRSIAAGDNPQPAEEVAAFGPVPIVATIRLEAVTTGLELFADVARLRRPDCCEKTLALLLQSL